MEVTEERIGDGEDFVMKRPLTKDFNDISNPKKNDNKDVLKHI